LVDSGDQVVGMCVDLQEVEFELLCVHHADGPHALSGRSARRFSASSSSCSSRVFVCLSFDQLCRWIFVARSSRTVRTRLPDDP
jgi:hypothetical protein